MLSRILMLASLCLAAPTAIAAAPAPKPVEVMVLGTYHFGNPGLDVNNMKADDVRAPKRQAELAAIAKALLTFRPTKIMVERQSAEPDLSVPVYRTFNTADLAASTNETVQIGYRVANAAGHKAVYGIDEQPKDGEPDYFPFAALQQAAAKFGQTAIIDAANADVQQWLKAFEQSQSTRSIAGLLITMNEPTGLQERADFYYEMLRIGDADAQPGADLNAMWYLRNAKIFGKLMRAAEPGDRIIVIYGSGHNFWLRHFARATPGFVSVDPTPYLRKAGR